MTDTTVQPVTRAAFVTEARTWIGTPYQHQGRLKGVACDCLGLLICTAQACGLTTFDITGYPKRPDGSLKDGLLNHIDVIRTDQAQAGDVLLFEWDHCPMHVGILTDETHLIHAFATNRRVVEHIIDDRWRALIAVTYHVPGVI
jgi:NlpC/P60 family putative phage cell wall peptidase